MSLTEPAMHRLMQHKWPGNIRELENCLERASVMSDSGVIDADQIRIDRVRDSHSANSNHGAHGIHVPHHGFAQAHAGGGNGSSPSPASQPVVDVNDPSIDERTRVVAALEQAGWVQAKAARLLGMTPRQIAYRIQTLNIEVKQF